MEELVGNTDGFADSGYVAFIGINSLINISLQRQLSNCTAVPWSNSRSGTVSACSDPGSCN